MRNRESDEQAIRDLVKAAGIDELVYITPNHYDGGYEVRVGVIDAFVDYDALDTADRGWLSNVTTPSSSLLIPRLRSGQAGGEAK